MEVKDSMSSDIAHIGYTRTDLCRLYILASQLPQRVASDQTKVVHEEIIKAVVGNISSI
jgi:hypothetical protein